MRKWLTLIGFWLLVTPLLLEVLVRAAVPVLPPALQLAAERVYKGESLDINRIGLMQMDIDHGFMMKTGVEDALYGPHQSVVFHVSTTQILDSRMGFRTDPVQQGDPVDVAVVGDSFSFCFTEYDDCWVSRFRQQTGLNTMNLAQGSTGSMSHWRFVDTFGRAFQPPLVIWQFFVNDFNEDYQLAVLRGDIEPVEVQSAIPDYELNTNPLLRWLREHSVAWVVTEIALVGEDAYISDFERYHFTRPYEVRYSGPDGQGHILRFGQRYEQIATNLSDPRISSGVAMTTEAVANAREAVESWGGQLAIFLVPTREEVYRHLTAPIMGGEAVDALGQTRREMLRICAELDLTCLDLLPGMQVYAQRGEHLYYTEDMHLNPRGNEVAADLVINWLRDRDLLP
jgi:hypothetical protein